MSVEVSVAAPVCAVWYVVKGRGTTLITRLPLDSEPFGPPFRTFSVKMPEGRCKLVLVGRSGSEYGPVGILEVKSITPSAETQTVVARWAGGRNVECRFKGHSVALDRGERDSPEVVATDLCRELTWAEGSEPDRGANGIPQLQIPPPNIRSDWNRHCHCLASVGVTLTPEKVAYHALAMFGWSGFWVKEEIDAILSPTITAGRSVDCEDMALNVAAAANWVIGATFTGKEAGAAAAAWLKAECRGAYLAAGAVTPCGASVISGHCWPILAPIKATGAWRSLEATTAAAHPWGAPPGQMWFDNAQERVIAAAEIRDTRCIFGPTGAWTVDGYTHWASLTWDMLRPIPQHPTHYTPLLVQWDGRAVITPEGRPVPSVGPGPPPLTVNRAKGDIAGLNTTQSLVGAQMAWSVGKVNKTDRLNLMRV